MLYIVPTPIGNLADVTARALHVLAQVDVIAAEDTRHSGFFLKHYGIHTPCIALHDHNERQKSHWLLSQLHQGKSIALISDAGTPLISDPGYYLTLVCQQAGFKVVPLPGPCAAVTALSAAGLPTDRFTFEGFLPTKTQARQTRLRALIDETRTMIFYESPRRILQMLTDVAEILGHRQVTLARELTKSYETIIQKPVVELIAWMQADVQQQRGEMVLIVQGRPALEKGEIPQAAKQTLALLKAHLPKKKAAAITAQIHGVSKNALYRELLDLP